MRNLGSFQTRLRGSTPVSSSDDSVLHTNACTCTHFCHSVLRLPSIGLLFGCVEGDAALLLVTRKLAGRVSDAPNDIPLMSLGLNFFLHEGARRKFLSSSWKRGGWRRRWVERSREEVCVTYHSSVSLCHCVGQCVMCVYVTSSILLSVPMASRLLYSRSRVVLAWKRQTRGGD